jgi:hypothetical protein
MGIWQEYHREFTAAFEEVRLLHKTPEQALHYCQERMSDSWSRYLLSLKRHHQVSPEQVPTTP